MTDPQNLLARAVGSEPPLNINWREITATGDRRVRRRRNLTVLTGTGALALILFGSSLVIGHLNGPALTSAAIPGCDAVLGPTGSPGPDPTMDATKETTSTTVEVQSPPTMDLAAAPDPLTQVVWNRLASWSVNVVDGSVFGNLVFATDAAAGSGAFNSTAGADGRVTSVAGDGELWISVGPDPDGVQPCRQGELDERIRTADGTITDFKTSTGFMQSSSGAQFGPFTTFQAVAHHPDGTLIVATASNAVPKFDDDHATSGQRPSNDVALTADQVVQLAQDPALRRTGTAVEAAYGQWTAVIPNVVGMSEDQARAALTALGFDVVVTPQLIEPNSPTEGATLGNITEQSPEAGRLTTPGSTVTPSAATSAATDPAIEYEYSADERLEVGDISGASVTDPSVRLSVADSPDQVVVLTIWGSWCGPCRQQVEALNQAAALSADRNVTFLGINVLDEPEAAADFITTQQVPFPSILDTKMAIVAHIPGVPTTGFPVTVVLDRHHKVAHLWRGQVTAIQLDAVIESLVSE